MVEAVVARGETAYGINTGFGKLAEMRIPLEELAALQRNLVRSHAAGVGEPLAEAGSESDAAAARECAGQGP